MEPVLYPSLFTSEHRGFPFVDIVSAVTGVVLVGNAEYRNVISWVCAVDSLGDAAMAKNDAAYRIGLQLPKLNQLLNRGGLSVSAFKEEMEKDVYNIRGQEALQLLCDLWVRGLAAECGVPADVRVDLYRGAERPLEDLISLKEILEG